MDMKKKLFLLSILGSIVLLFIGCAGNNFSTNENPSYSSEEFLTDKDFYSKNTYPTKPTSEGIICNIISWDSEKQELGLSIQNNLDVTLEYKPVQYIEHSSSEKKSYEAYIGLSKQVDGEWKDIVLRNPSTDIAFDPPLPEVGKGNRYLDINSKLEKTYTLYPYYPVLTAGKYRVIVSDSPILAAEFEVS